VSVSSVLIEKLFKRKARIDYKIQHKTSASAPGAGRCSTRGERIGHEENLTMIKCGCGLIIMSMIIALFGLLPSA
jgi:hypothetical protein